MPAKSKAQQTAFGMALAARRGSMPSSKLKGSSLKIFKSKMTNTQIRDFAKTERTGLPQKKRKAKPKRKARAKRKARR